MIEGLGLQMGLGHPGFLGIGRHVQRKPFQGVAEETRRSLQRPFTGYQEDVPLAADFDFSQKIVELLRVDGGPQDIKSAVRQVVLDGYDQVGLLPKP